MFLRVAEKRDTSDDTTITISLKPRNNGSNYYVIIGTEPGSCPIGMYMLEEKTTSSAAVLTLVSEADRSTDFTVLRNMGDHQGVIITVGGFKYELTADSVILAAYSDDFSGDNKTWMSAPDTDEKHCNRLVELSNTHSNEEISVIFHVLLRLLRYSGIEEWVMSITPRPIDLQMLKEKK